MELRDDKNKISITGHPSCITETDTKIKSLDNYRKKTNEQILKEIGLKLN